MRAWNQPWKKSRNRFETRERIELSAGPGNETGRDRDSWPSEAGILVLVSDRPRSRPYKKPRHAANATATAPTARYNTITRNRPLFRPSHGCSIRPTIEQSNAGGGSPRRRARKSSNGRTAGPLARNLARKTSFAKLHRQPRYLNSSTTGDGFVVPPRPHPRQRERERDQPVSFMYASLVF